MAVDATTFKAVMGQWPSGVTVVTTTDDNGPAGMTASSFSSVSLDPPLISVCVARHLAMHERIRRAGLFAVNILRKDNVDDGLRFAGMLPGVRDRFEGVEFSTAATGAPLLPKTQGWLDCRIWATYDGGDHTIFVGEVQAAQTDPTASPLLYLSRAWGQFADVLVQDVSLHDAADTAEAIMLHNAFGEDATQAMDLDRLTDAVREALATAQPSQRLVLDDTAGAADPVRLRQAIQAIGGLTGRTEVALRIGAGPMALALVLVGLKSGVRHLLVARDNASPYVAGSEVQQMLQRMHIQTTDF